MEWNFKKDQDVLKRIIALLLAMAGLAEAACVASYPVRRRVLEILLPAEAVAQESVLGMARNLGAPIPPQAYLAICGLVFTHEGDGPADAACLGLRLRALALALASLSMWAGRFASRVTVGAQNIGIQTEASSRPIRSAGRRKQVVSPVQPPDTS